MREKLALWFFNDEKLSDIFLWLSGTLIFFNFNTLLLAILNGKKEVKFFVLANIYGSLASLLITTFLVLIFLFYFFEKEGGCLKVRLFFGKRTAQYYISYIVICLFQKIKIYIYKIFLSNNKPRLYKTKIYQPVQFFGDGDIELNEISIGVMSSSGFLSQPSYLEARNRKAKIIIGKGTFINNGATIVADKSSVEIGTDCLIGTGVTIYDSDFHGLNLDDRLTQNYETSSVIIEDEVFIGSGVTILKGVRIGRGAVIGAGSVVTKDVGEFEIHAGFPAKFIRRLK